MWHSLYFWMNEWQDRCWDRDENVFLLVNPTNNTYLVSIKSNSITKRFRTTLREADLVHSSRLLFAGQNISFVQLEQMDSYVSLEFIFQVLSIYPWSDVFLYIFNTAYWYTILITLMHVANINMKNNHHSNSSWNSWMS